MTNSSYIWGCYHTITNHTIYIHRGTTSTVYFICKPRTNKTGQVGLEIEWVPLQSNFQFNKPLFQTESPKIIQTKMQKDLWCTYIDLKDTYFHIPINKTYRKCESRSYRESVTITSISWWTMEMWHHLRIDRLYIWF